MKKRVPCTIIIPHYNSPEKLVRLLESILHEKKNYQIIVVDDRSDKDIERLQEIRKEYSPKGVEFYKNKNHRKGAGSARNIGLRHAQGEWVIFADADDYFVSGFSTAVEHYLNSEYDIVIFTMTSRIEGTDKESWRHLYLKNLIDDYRADGSRKNELRLRYADARSVSKLIRLDLIKDNDIYFDEVTLSNDVTFSTRCSFNAKKIHASEEIIYCATENTENLTSRKGADILRCKMKIGIKQLKFLKENLPGDDLDLLGLRADGLFVDAVHKGYPLVVILGWMAVYLYNGLLPLSTVGIIEVIKAELFRIPRMEGVYTRIRGAFPGKN